MTLGGVELSSKGINYCHLHNSRLFKWIELLVGVKRIYENSLSVDDTGGGVELSSKGINCCHLHNSRLFKWIELLVGDKRIYVNTLYVETLGGLSSLVKELTIATCIIQGSSNELSYW